MTVTQFPYLATFMDAIKSDTHLFDAMHFIDYPYQTGGDYIAPNPESINGVQALSEAAKSLIFSPRDDTKGQIRVWSKAFSLLLFVHVFGDVHQPLHAVSLFSEEFTPPLGDMGGNLWTIDYTSEVDGMTYSQMHLLFDCVGGLWCTYMPHPVTSEFTANVSRYADAIMAEYPITMFAPDDLVANYTTPNDFKETMYKWTKESFELAKVAYSSYPLGKTISQQDIQWARAMLKKQIALAGYRMAKVLAEMDTSIYMEPNREQIQQYWRAICIATIGVAVLALIALVLVFRKYKDYKQLADQKTATLSTVQYSALE